MKFVDIEELKKEIKRLEKENRALKRAIKDLELAKSSFYEDHREEEEENDWKYGSD